jgi:hypothetical protein
MALLRFPEPFDFELSTERFRAFGPDLANLWVDGGLHRVVGVGELRIEPAPGGVDVEPLDRETRRVALTLLGAPFDLEGFYAWAQDDPVLRGLTEQLAGFRPPLARTVRDARHLDHRPAVSLHAAFAIRNRRSSASAGGSARHAFPTAEQLRRPPRRPESARLLEPQGRVRARACAGTSRPASSSRCRTTRSSGGSSDPRARRVDGRVVPRPASRRPGAWPVGDIALEKAVRAFYPDLTDLEAARERFEPFQNLSAHYLLTGARVGTP